MRVSRDERAEKDGGSDVGGRESGRKPLGMETVKGGRVARSLSSVGMVTRRGKVGGAAREPIFYKTILLRKGWMFFRVGVWYAKEGWCGWEKFWVYVLLAGTLPATNS